jgi:hypothetical protein
MSTAVKSGWGLRGLLLAVGAGLPEAVGLPEGVAVPEAGAGQAEEFMMEGIDQRHHITGYIPRDEPPRHPATSCHVVRNRITSESHPNHIASEFK